MNLFSFRLLKKLKNKGKLKDKEKKNKIIRHGGQNNYTMRKVKEKKKEENRLLFFELQ